jgi:phosphoadenosine phosphosulfate reductase
MSTSSKTKPAKAAAKKSPRLDLEAINKQLASLSAMERIEWALTSFDSGLYALTSAGIDSALMLDHVAHMSRPVPVIHINTGFLPEQTLDFRDELERRYGFALYEFGPSEEQIADVTMLRLWDGDLATYSKITKLDPMRKAIRELKVAALLTAVRADQTDNRATLRYIGEGNDGELRIHPFIDWPKTQVNDYIEKHSLPRNPLHKKGFESVGDLHVTQPGHDRQGRTVMECGLHVVGGKVIKGTS